MSGAGQTMHRSRFLFYMLVATTVLCSVVPYVRLYFGRHNSLYDDAAYAALLTLWTLSLYGRGFKRFVLSKRNPLNPFALAVSVLLAVDVAINAPLNLYKVKMYVLLYAMYLLTFLFTHLTERSKTRLIGYLLLTWLGTSIAELLLRFTYPSLFDTFPWNGMTLQTALKVLVQQGALTIVQSKVYGLGIGSQANIVALMALLIAIACGVFRQMGPLLRNRAIAAMVFLITMALVPFSLSLTSIIAFLCAIGVVVLRHGVRFAPRAAVGIWLIMAVTVGLLGFDIGALFRFAASVENRESYIYEFVQWPLAYLSQHTLSIFSGLHADIRTAPLENRYFNVLLTLGLPLTVYVAATLVRLFMTCLRRSGAERYGKLKLMLFVLLTVSYLHIGFAAHVPGLILLATLFVFVTERSGSAAVSRSAAGAAMAPPRSDAERTTAPSAAA